MSIFNLYFRTWHGETIKCGRAQLVEDNNKRLEQVHFKYHDDFLNSSYFAIDPKHLPKQSELKNFECDKEAPGFIDDILPDDWGKKVISRIHGFRHKPSIIELLTVMNNATTGALFFKHQDADQTIEFGRGCKKADITELHRIANKIDLGLATSEEIEQIKLTLFSRGSSVGGARPKVLVHDENTAYIAKFAKRDDDFDYASVEHACLSLMRRAELNVADSFVEAPQINEPFFNKNHQILYVERFDINAKTDGRYHQITANALLKSSHNQTDPVTGKYDDIANLISLYSAHPQKDNAQLFAQMLFNKVFNNTDDHLRNFSFTCKEDGWQLSPAYDVVPSLAFGRYHQLDVGYSSILPNIINAASCHRSFNLTKPQAQQVVEQVIDVCSKWEDHFADCGVSESDMHLLSRVIKLD